MGTVKLDGIESRLLGSFCCISKRTNHAPDLLFRDRTILLSIVRIVCNRAASRTKTTYFRAQFRRISSRRGAKRALVAVAHSLLTAAYHVLRDHTTYRELGADLFDRLKHGRLRSYYIKRLKSLGYEVDVKEAQPAA